MDPCCGDRSRMTPFLTLVLAGFLSRVGYQMARSPVLPRFAQDLGAAPELIGIIVAASTVGPLAGGLLLFCTASSSMTYLAVGVLGLLPLVMVVRLPDHDARASTGSTLAERSRQFRSGIREVLRSRAVLVASTLEAAMYVGYGAFLGFFPTYARGVGLNDAQIALVMGAQLATTVLAKPLSGRLSDRLGRKPMIVAGLLLCAATLPAIPAFASLWLLLLPSALFGLG